MRIPAGAAFALCVAVWGGSWYAIGAAVEGADPLGIAALRATGAFVLLALLALALRLPRPDLGGALRGMGVGLVLIGANFALVFWGAARVPPGLAALLYATTPLQAALLSGFVRVDALSLRLVVGASVGLVAVGFAFVDLRSVTALSLVGAVAILLGATASAAGSVMARRWSTLDPVWLNVSANASAALLLWAHYALAGEGGFLPQGTAGWIGFLYMLVGGSVLAFLAYFQLLRQWDAARASFATLTTPFVALGIGAVAFAQPVRGSELVGAVVLIVAGYLAMARPSAATARRISAARNRLSEKYRRRYSPKVASSTPGIRRNP